MNKAEYMDLVKQGKDEYKKFDTALDNHNREVILGIDFEKVKIYQHNMQMLATLASKNFGISQREFFRTIMQSDA